MESSHEIISRIAGRNGPRTVADAQGQPVPHPTMEKDAQTDVRPEAANRSIASAASAAVGEAANAVKSALFPQPVPIATTAHGIPMGDISHSYNVNGIISTSDANIIEQQQLFNRSKIVERQVHACGSGAFGAFRVTGDVSRLTKAKFLQPGSAETPIFARFSTVTYGREFPDSARNPRGMALKFYTEEGNYDVLMINFPVFFCRDPALGPSVIRSQARNPQNFQVNLDATVDFMSLVPESSLANVWFWSDHGTPVGWRFLDAYPCHTFKWVNAEGAATWVRYVFKSQQGIKNFDFDSAVKMCGEDPDFAKKDLWQTIADGGRPKWTFFIQTMTDEQATSAPFDAFDATKEWPTDQYPLMQVGELTLDRNPENYHRDVEQAAFSPGRMVPGIEPSPDLLLQFRCWFYGDAQLYRLGPNYHQIPVNCPFMAKQYHPTSRDGPTRVDTNGGVEAAYFPNSFSHPPMPHPAPHAIWQPVKVSGELARKAADRSDEGTDREYQQATRFYQKSLSDEERKHLHYNIAKAFKLVTRSDVKLRFLHQAYKVHPDYAAGIIQQAHALGALENSVTLKKVQELVSKLPHTVDQSRGYVPLPLPSV